MEWIFVFEGVMIMLSKYMENLKVTVVAFGLVLCLLVKSIMVIILWYRSSL